MKQKLRLMGLYCPKRTQSIHHIHPQSIRDKWNTNTGNSRIRPVFSRTFFSLFPTIFREFIGAHPRSIRENHGYSADTFRIRHARGENKGRGQAGKGVPRLESVTAIPCSSLPSLIPHPCDIPVIPVYTSVKRPKDGTLPRSIRQTYGKNAHSGRQRIAQGSDWDHAGDRLGSASEIGASSKLTRSTLVLVCANQGTTKSKRRLSQGTTKLRSHTEEYPAENRSTVRSPAAWDWFEYGRVLVQQLLTIASAFSRSVAEGLSKASRTLLEALSKDCRTSLEQQSNNGRRTIEESCVCTRAMAPARSGLGLALGLVVLLFVTAPKCGVSQESFYVSGKVISAVSGIAIEGATVTNKRTRIHTATDRMGEYRIAARPDDILAYSFVGYVTTEQEINGRQQISVALDSAERMLEEVEVLSTGYQRIAKERATGSFVQLDNDLINRRVSTNILDRLDGVTSGLVFNRNNQGGGNETPISIRGRSTIFANPEPLIILDNFPYEGNLAGINPNDIESVTVLKDAAAASIWGVKAGNGVIVLTSKRGRQNRKPIVTFNVNATLSEKPDLYYLPQLTSKEFIGVERFLFDKGKYNAAINNGYGAISPAVEILLQARDNGFSQNRLDQMLDSLAQFDVRRDIGRHLYHTALNQQYQMTVSGGGQNHMYYLSAGLDRNRPVSRYEGFRRATLNANNTYRLFGDIVEIQNSLLVGSTAQFNHHAPYRASNPYDRLADNEGEPLPVSDGTLRLSYLDGLDPSIGLLDWYYRPLDELMPNNRNDETSLRLNNSLKFNVASGLSLSLQYLFQRSFSQAVNENMADSYYTRNRINTLTQYDAETGELLRPIPLGGIRFTTDGLYTLHNGRAQLDYSKTFADIHELNGIAGYEVNSGRRESTSAGFYGYNPDTKIDLNASMDFSANYRQFFRSSTTRIAPNTDGAAIVDRFVSYYANMSYALKRTWVFSGSFRQDASNLFGVKSNFRRVPLWSIGLLYKLGNERYFANPYLSALSLRATYGFNGNVDRSTAAFLTARPVGVGIWNSFFSEILNPPNPSLRWERVRNVNIGMDFTATGNRLSGTIEYYEKAGLDLIGNSPVAPQTGVSVFKGNSASTLTKGVDAMVNVGFTRPTSVIQWTGNLLFNYVHDEVTAYHVEQGSNNDVLSANYRNPMVGYPYNSVFAYRWAGLDDQGSPQALLDGEVSRDYVTIRNSTNRENIVYVGAGSPTVFGGIRNTLAWKGLNVSVNVLYKMGYYVRRKSLDNYALYNSYNYQQPDYNRRWQQPGDELSTNVPALVYPASIPRTYVYLDSDVLVERGDHIRLQDIQIAYRFPEVNLMGASWKNLTCYGYVNNLGVLWASNDEGLDPDNIFSPPVRTYSFGLSFSF